MRFLRFVAVSILLADILPSDPYMYTDFTRKLGISFGEKYPEVKDVFDSGKYYDRGAGQTFQLTVSSLNQIRSPKGRMLARIKAAFPSAFASARA